MQLSELTSNQYYRGLNRRFDRRYRLLMTHGCYNMDDKGVRDRLFKSKLMTKPIVIMNTSIMHMSNFAWRQFLADTLLRP